MEKVRKMFRFDSDMVEELESWAKTNRTTQTKALELAWDLFKQKDQGDYDVIADIFLEKYKTEYDDLLCRWNQKLKAIDISSQVQTEMFNTLMINLSVKEVAPISTSPSPVYSGATDEVKAKIEKQQKKSNWRRSE